MAHAHISQESQVDGTAELLVIYNIELVSYFLPNPITIHRRSLLLPLANPNTSEIITNHPSTTSTSISKGGLMAKSDAQKKTRVMAKEWWKSRSNEQTIEDLVIMGVLHNKALVGWRAPEGEGYPDPQTGEIVVFKDFFKQGFGVPVHPFLQGLFLYYENGICNMHPNSILLVSTFIHLCEACGGFQPHFDCPRFLGDVRTCHRRLFSQPRDLWQYTCPFVTSVRTFSLLV